MKFQILASLLKEAVFDALFPLSRRQKIVRSITASKLAKLRRAHLREPNRHAVFSHQDPKVQAIIHTAKYEHNEKSQKLMSTFLREEILAICADKRIFDKTIHLVPIPSSLRKNMINASHTHKIARNITKENDSFGTLSILQKVRKTPAQTHLERRRRLQNVRGAFRADNRNLSNKAIFIIDDVTTTGATFKEAARAIYEIGTPNQLHCVAFSH